MYAIECFPVGNTVDRTVEFCNTLQFFGTGSKRLNLTKNQPT